MREILFRGKCVDSGEWVYGVPIKKALVGSHDGYYPKIIPECDGRHQTVYSTAIKEETLGQYTGLTDKNGTRIFEGDIVGAKHPEQKKAVPCFVKYGEYEDEDSSVDCCYLGFYLEAFCKCCSILTPLSDGIEYEVIGNIYDNPELLTE